jgi:hypothetical protein
MRAFAAADAARRQTRYAILPPARHAISIFSLSSCFSTARLRLLSSAFHAAIRLRRRHCRSLSHFRRRIDSSPMPRRFVACFAGAERCACATPRFAMLAPFAVIFTFFRYFCVFAAFSPPMPTFYADAFAAERHAACRLLPPPP